MTMSIHADETVFLSNQLTHHWSSTGAKNFANKSSRDGRTIKNELYAISILTKSEDSFRKNIFFGGEDSIGSPMFGYARVFGWHEYNDTGLNIGGIFGGYIFDQNEWDRVYKDEIHKTPSFVTAATGMRNVNVVIGINIDLSLKLTDQVKLKLDNTITPMITTHAIGISFEF